jgi:hypothetical protein
MDDLTRFTHIFIGLDLTIGDLHFQNPEPKLVTFET